MKNCHVCNALMEDDAELCSVCGAEFLGEAQAEETEDIILNEPVLAASVGDLITAQIFCDMLAENKIPYSMGEDAENFSMQITFGGGFADIDIYVDKSDFEKSQEIYEKMLSEAPQIEDLEDFEDFEGLEESKD